MSAEIASRQAALFAALLAFGCRSEPPRPTDALPLASFVESMRAQRETVSLDFGEAAARRFLALGFGPDEVGPEGSYVRVDGASALVRLELWRPRDRRLRLRAWSTAPGETPVGVLVSLGGRPVGRWDVVPEPATYELELPARFWRPGENLLRFTATTRGADLPLAIAGLLFAGEREAALAAPAPRFSSEGDLVLPAGSEAIFELELPGGSWFSWRSTEPSPDDLRLELSCRTENDDESRISRPAGGLHRVALTGETSALARLALRASGDVGGELRVLGPTLEVPIQGAPRTPSGVTAARPVELRASRPNIVVYIVDTLRADHLGCYGYPRPTSPALDRFAEGAVLYTEARAQSSWTRPAIASILTGLQPITHQAQNIDQRIGLAIDTLPELLGAAGYRTAMVTTNGNVAARFGFRQGFDHFEYLREDEATPELHVLSDVAGSRASRFLPGRERDRPFLLVVHCTDPHDPYAPREPFRSRLALGVPLEAGSAARVRELEERGLSLPATDLADLVSLYDAEIAQNDAAFGALLDELERRRLAETTAVLFLSDHGEEFHEHDGWIHGKTLYEEQLRIPLVLRLPHGEGAGARPTAVAQQIDVLPTLLELAGVAPPPGLPGRSLLADLRDVPAPPTAAFAWLARDGYRTRAMRAGIWKLIVRPGGPRARSPYAELYRLDRDPGEQEDLALRLELRRDWLEARLLAGMERWAPRLPVETVKVGPEMRRHLRALGYLR